MTIVKQLILLLIGGGLLLLAVRRLRQYRLKERYTLIFLLIGLPFLVLSLWPGGVGWVADLLGIDYRTVMLLCVTGFFLLSMLELLTIVSVQDRKLTTLAQMVGILMQSRHDADRAGREASAAVGASHLDARTVATHAKGHGTDPFSEDHRPADSRSGGVRG